MNNEKKIKEINKIPLIRKKDSIENYHSRLNNEKIKE